VQSPAERPDAEMMAVAERLARFIATGARDLPAGLFAESGVSIVENFPPYLFEGPDALAAWSQQMQLHLEGQTELRHRFEEVQDFSRSGDEVYFSLRTVWSGLNRGKPFEETGGWALVLTRQAESWRILAYGWAVIGHPA
jgi:hypothetical protein